MIHLRNLRRLISGKTLVLADQLTFSGGSFILTVGLARMLGPSEFGLFSSLILVIFLLVSALNAMVIQPYQVSAPRYEGASSYTSFAFWAHTALVAFVVSVFALLVLVFHVRLPFEIGSGPGIFLLPAGFLMHDFFRKLFLARAELGKALALDVLLVVFNFLALAAAFFIGRPDMRSVTLLLGLSYLPSVAAGTLLLRPGLPAWTSWKAYARVHIEQGRWLLLTAFVQWWSGNLFVVMSGVFLGLQALGAFRLVQSLFGLLNVLLQTFENYVLPNASRILATSAADARLYLRHTSLRAGLLFGAVLLALFLFPRTFIQLAGGAGYASFAYVVQGMALLYVFILIGYPVRLSIRMLVLNRSFFIGYLLSLGFSLVSFRFLLENYHLGGALAGLIISQLIVLTYWQYVLSKKQFLIWK